MISAHNACDVVLLQERAGLAQRVGGDAFVPQRSRLAWFEHQSKMFQCRIFLIVKREEGFDLRERTSMGTVGNQPATGQSGGKQDDARSNRWMIDRRQLLATERATRTELQAPGNRSRPKAITD